MFCFLFLVKYGKTARNLTRVKGQPDVWKLKRLISSSGYIAKDFFWGAVRTGLGIPMGTEDPNMADTLLITGVIDGPLLNNPRGVELYVGNDIPDLSIYGLGNANNGGGTDGQEFTFPAVSVTAGTYIYVGVESTEWTNYLGFAPDYTSPAMSINGDDAIELFENGAVIDVYGDINTDGTGQTWEYTDGWAYRTSGTPALTVFAASDWEYSGKNALDGSKFHCRKKVTRYTKSFFFFNSNNKCWRF